MFQIILFMLSVLRVGLSQREDLNFRKWSSVAGLVSEPLWFIATWGEWGMFSVSVVYYFIWAESFYRNFILKKLTNE